MLRLHPHQPLLLTPEAMLLTMAAATSLGFLMRGSNTSDTPLFVVMSGYSNAVGCASAICTPSFQSSIDLRANPGKLIQPNVDVRCQFCMGKL